MIVTLLDSNISGTLIDRVAVYIDTGNNMIEFQVRNEDAIAIRKSNV